MATRGLRDAGSKVRGGTVNTPMTADGSRRFRLGAVEIAVIVAVVAIAGWALHQQYESIIESQNHGAAQVADLVTKVAVLQGQVATLSQQLSDVPALTRQVAELQVHSQEQDRRLSRLEDGKQ